MKACPCLAGVAALALALTVALVPGTTASAQPPAKPKPAWSSDKLLRNPNSPYVHTAIGAVIDANDGKVPNTGEELVKTLAKLGDFVQLPVTFSAVALHSGLKQPRVVITMCPSTHPRPREDFGWGYGSKPHTFTPPPEPLNHIAANHTQLEGRLFLAANTETDSRGGLNVKTVEFISWNTRKLKFDFGVIDGLGEKPELRMLDGVRCFTCHKNRGPILGVSPWSNTTANALVRKTLDDAVFHRITLLTGQEARDQLHTDGMALLESHAIQVDAAVRMGGDLLRDRAIFKQLLSSPEGRKAFVLLCTTILTGGELEKHDKQIKTELNKIPLGRFLRESHVIRQTAISNKLTDYSPAGQVRNEVVQWTTDKTPTDVRQLKYTNQVLRYDEARAMGNINLPTTHVPSNPKAFIRDTTNAPRRPSEVVNAVLLAKTIGLTEKDREFLADALDETVKRLNSRADTRLAVTVQLFAGPSFNEMMTTGELPDRDDFKDRVIEGLTTILKNRKFNDDFWGARDQYASTPKADPQAKPMNDLEVLPSHACLGCHDVRGVGKPAFNPIPKLAFDPFDVTAREKWLKVTDQKQKAEVLSRLMKRLATDKTMPPEDSTEYELYRVKDPTALNAVKDWLEAELKKTKGN